MANNPPLRLHRIVDVPLAGGSSRFDYQSLDQHRHLLFVAHLGANMVTIFDTRTNVVVRNIPHVAGVHGVLVVPSLHRVYASATDDNAIVLIDEGTLRVIGKLPVGEYPDGLAYDPARHRLFVSDEAGRTDTVIDTRHEKRTATVRLGGEAGNTQYDPVSGRIFVDVQTRNDLAAIDPRTNRVVARYALPGCRHDHGLLIDSTRRLAFVTCDENARLLVVDMHTFRVRSVSTVGAEPDVLVFDAGLRRLYVAAESGVVSVLGEQGRSLVKLGQAFVAPAAHTIQVDSQTHRVYLPLEGVHNRPVLRVMAPPGGR